MGCPPGEENGQWNVVVFGESAQEHSGQISLFFILICAFSLQFYFLTLNKNLKIKTNPQKLIL